jgi:hemerythrin-like domain-containing protein
MTITATDNARRTTTLDGFDVLDACHQEMLAKVEQLGELVLHLEYHGLDDQARASAKAIAHFFSVTARDHHQDEERHIFPPLAQSDDPHIVQAVLRLQQDHGWLEEDWMEISPHVQAVAAGYNGYDIDILREGTAVFAALVRDHVALEESFIYPQARRQTDAAQRKEMGREMAARRRAEHAARKGS